MIFFLEALQINLKNLRVKFFNGADMSQISEGKNIRDLGEKILGLLDSYHDSVKKRELRVLEIKPINNLIEELGIGDLITKAPLSDDLLFEFLEKFLENSNRIHHPCNIGHQLAPSQFPSALADLFNGSINNGSGLYEMGPASSVVEREIINWMLKKIGWNVPLFSTSTGLLCSGGTIANLTALLAARNDVCPEAWEDGVGNDVVILAPDSSHFSISRAAGIIGIGVNSVVCIETDAIGRIIPYKLDEVIYQEKEKGKIIIAVVANACSTSTGIYDDLVKIGEICNENNIWLHVDGAHGMSAIITKKYSDFLKGIDRADSVTWDAHKMLQTSSVCAAVLFKSDKLIDGVFRQSASYLSFDRNEEYPNQMRRTIECTKPAIGLKLLFNLLILGEQYLENNIEQLYDKARWFYKLIQKYELFECAFKPQSNILCFRLDGLTNSHHKYIREKVIENGNFFITETEINGCAYFRITIMNNETSENDIKILLKEITQIAGSIGGGNEFPD